MKRKKRIATTSKKSTRSGSESFTSVYGSLMTGRTRRHDSVSRRGNMTTEYWWGKKWNPQLCWCLENSQGRPREVTGHKPNRLGLVEVFGNVGEITTASLGNGFVVRGGSFRKPGEPCGWSNREPIPSNEARDDVGVRVVIDLYR